MMRHTNNSGSTGWGRAPYLFTGVLVAALSACDTDSILNLPDPDLITTEVVQDTANVQIVRNGVLFEFARAYSGSASNAGDIGQIQVSGLLADELWFSSTYPTHREIDQRNVTLTNTSAETAFQYLQRARNLAERATDLYGTAAQANSADHALVANLAGFSYVMFAENYCSGVPFSVAPFTGNLELSPPLPTDSVFNRAVARFDQAITIGQSAGSSAMTNLARVGRARALLGMGRFADAAATAAQVADGFEYDVEYASPSPQNGVWFWIVSNRRLSPATEEGGNGLRYFNRGPRGTNTIDPRVTTDSVGFGLSSAPPLPQYSVNSLFPDQDSDISLATYREARLIQAEAALNKGASNAYLPILNQLRSEIGLAPLADPVDSQARVRQLFQERAYWLWMTSHRLGDLRRLIRHYPGFTPANTFPVGTTIFGTAYGDDTSMPVPFSETNNPNFTTPCTNNT